MAGTYSSVLGNAGEPLRLRDEANNRTWQISYITHGKMAAFENWMRQEALKSVASLRGSVPEETYQEMLRETVRDCSTGAYVYGGALCQQALKNAGGLLALTMLLMKDEETGRSPTREELDDLSGRLGDQLMGLLRIVLEESASRHAKGNKEGNAEPLPGT